jgi:transcriptional/translational regulatory protein YebC/TACO1
MKRIRYQVQEIQGYPSSRNPFPMSGHSKWSKIKHQKGAADVKKGRVFSQLSKLITIAVREGKSGNPDENPRLRMILEKARQANLPKDNVNRAIDRGLRKGSEGALAQVTIEGYGPGGVAVMATAMTDNQNRTRSDIRQIFERRGGSIGEPGSVGYIFAAGAPSYTISVSGPDVVAVKNLLDELEDHDDVEVVLHNAQLTNVQA